MSHHAEYNFCIVGCGGVGSRIAPELRKQYPKSRILFIDGDIFEKKNLDRQMFPEDAIGHNKAEVMATIHKGEHLPEMLSDVTSIPRWVNVIIVAVDNNKARRAAIAHADTLGVPCVVCANEEIEAQAYWYEPSMKGTRMDPRVRYENLSQDPVSQGPACVTAAIESDDGSQTPLANTLAATFGLLLIHAQTKFRHGLSEDGVAHTAIEYHTNGNSLRTLKIIDFAVVNGTPHPLIN